MICSKQSHAPSVWKPNELTGLNRGRFEPAVHEQCAAAMRLTLVQTVPTDGWTR